MHECVVHHPHDQHGQHEQICEDITQVLNILLYFIRVFCVGVITFCILLTYAQALLIKMDTIDMYQEAAFRAMWACIYMCI